MDILQINEINKITRMDKFIYRILPFLAIIIIPELSGVFGYDEQPNIRRLLYLFLFVYLFWVSRTISKTESEFIKLVKVGESIELYKYGSLDNRFKINDLKSVYIKDNVISKKLMLNESSGIEYTHKFSRDSNIVTNRLDELALI